MNRGFRALLLVAALAVGLPAAAQQFVGSYAVSDGALYTTNPPVYSAREAAALVFGGNAGDYLISTNSDTSNPASITRTGWYSTWGVGCSTFNENYKLDDAPPGYNVPGGTGTAASAFVNDWCDSGERNYVWRAGSGAQIPTLQTWALLLMALLVGGFAWRALRRSGRIAG